MLSLLYLALMGSVVAMLASTLFEEYRWTARALAGMFLVLAGLLRTPPEEGPLA